MKRDADREEVQAEGIACYRLFIEALLSLTDNIRDGAVVPPAGIVRRDGDDPYLVVAADKGTATFSDYANEISLDRGFWLGDAFASGGSAGYDHKRMGITARGAWECVKRHFREMDIDIQNAAVPRRRRRRHVGRRVRQRDAAVRRRSASSPRSTIATSSSIPHPIPTTAFAERKRLFELPRSSWADYDRARISAGGGVFSRAAKSDLRCRPQMQALLGIEAARVVAGRADPGDPALRDGPALVRRHRHVRARDATRPTSRPATAPNDALRIAASELRAKVIGEGANLGVTQRARIEAASRGVRLNTDFIDNSAGVNTSDQEVNIKIALEPALAVATPVARGPQPPAGVDVVGCRRAPCSPTIGRRRSRCRWPSGRAPQDHDALTSGWRGTSRSAA